MKKPLVFSLLIAFFAFCLCACMEKDQEAPPQPPVASQTPSTVVQDAPEAVEQAPQLAEVETEAEAELPVIAEETAQVVTVQPAAEETVQVSAVQPTVEEAVQATAAQPAVDAPPSTPAPQAAVPAKTGASAPSETDVSTSEPTASQHVEDLASCDCFLCKEEE